MLLGWPVKKSSYETVAATLALVGAFVLVGVYVPILNPGLTKLALRMELPSLGYYIVATPIPVFLLLAAWHFNKKARAIKEQSEQSPRVPEPAWQKRLKWILCAIVIVLVLFTFLW